MNHQIEIRSDLLQEYLYDVITEAQKEYNQLFSKPWSIDNKEIAEQYLRVYHDYEWHTEMLRRLNVFNWLDKELKLYDRNDVKIVI